MLVVCRRLSDYKLTQLSLAEMEFDQNVAELSRQQILCVELQARPGMRHEPRAGLLQSVAKPLHVCE